MTNRTQVRVNLAERAYNIEIGPDVLSTAAEFASGCVKLTHAVVITDSTVDTLYGDTVRQSLEAAGIRVTYLSVEAGETSKTVGHALNLMEAMLEDGADRKSVVFAVGGGVVGDLAGWVAASYARGLSFIQIPTTLLAQVDSSVGGKTGVNLPGAKNMVGAFWQPAGVLIDVDTLSTLPEREYRAGLAEVVKYGVILDAPFFQFLEEQVEAINYRDADVLSTVVARCCRLKADVVENDERETTGLRAVLNYGHTFCHAIEAVSGYGELLHGEAVSIGMLCASRLAESLGRVDAAFTQRQFNLLMALGLPVDTPPLDRDALLDMMQRDKKVEHGRLRFVLPTKMGHVELVGNVDRELARAAFDA